MHERSKHGNKKHRIDGYLFDSLKEAARYAELKLLERAEQIADLEVRPRFSLDLNGYHICNFTPDFRYRDLLSNKIIVEDVKGISLRRRRGKRFTTKTAAFGLKIKLLKALHGIEVTIV